MAKTIRKIITMVLAICICTCMIIPQALAAEITTESTTEGGITTTVTTTKDTVVDGDTTTTTETVETTTEGTDADGVTVSGKETTVDTTITEADGTITETTVTDGSETKSWTEDVEVGDENQPEVEVELIPGETTTGSGTTTSTETTGDVPAGSDDAEYDYTESKVVINKDVTVETSDIKVEVTESDATLTPLAPEDYEGKGYDNKEGLIVGLTPDQLGAYSSSFDQPAVDGYNFQWTGYGEATNACRAQSGFVVYLRDDDGNLQLDADGNPIIKSVTFPSNDDDGMGSTPALFALTTYDEDGNPEETHYYAYCIDNDTDAVPGAWYRISNLEDSDYYPDPENADYLRAVAMNGYWGQKEGMGSYTEMRDKILAYYGEDGTVTVDDKNGNPVTFKVSEIIDTMTEADALTMTQAAIWSYSNGSLSTKDGNDGKTVLGVYSVIKPKSNLMNCDRDYDSKRDAVLKAGYEWLISLPGMPAPDSSTVINEKHFLEDASIVIGDKVGEDAETGNGVYQTSVSFALGFKPGEEDDLLLELTFTTKDAKEVTVTKRIAGTNAEGEDYDTLVADEDGRYTLSDSKLQLTENEDFLFDFVLKGTQVLENGVYIYESYVGETTGDLVYGKPSAGHGTVQHNESQTFVGIASGTQDVTVHTTMTVSFNVEEEKEIETHQQWHSESDPVITPPEDPEQPVNPPAPPVVPPYIPEEEPPTATIELDGEVILDEEVPLADVPATGDASALWLLLSVAVIIGLVLVNLSNKKRTEA